MRLALSFPPSAACRFLDLPPVNLRNLHLHLTKNPFAGQPPHLCGVTLRIAAPEIRRGDPGWPKPPESSRGPKPSRLLIEPGGVYGGCGRIFAAENPIFQSKNRFLADFAPGDFEEILAKSGRGGDPGGIRTHGLSLRRTRVVLFVHLVSFDFPSFHLDLPRNSASFPKRQTGLIVGFVWLFRTPLLAEFQLFPIPRKPAIPSLPQGKEMQSRKERLALLCPAAFFCT